jgi:CheY-like chemotaxis protein
MFQTTDEAARQDMLADVYVRIHSFTPKADLPAMHPAIQMSAALEGLTRKLLEDPRRRTVSTLITLAAGVEMLNDLCELGLNSDLVTHPPIRMLVVDDDPVARRAVVGTLQLVFGKPESADSGAAALALTAAKPFDVIFLDVQMPGMDGFEVCAKIRESGPNRNTPVVFVSGQNDFNVRNLMSASGGSDFVSKPLLTAEITVKALTFALRGRLQKLEAGRV